MKTMKKLFSIVTIATMLISTSSLKTFAYSKAEENVDSMISDIQTEDYYRNKRAVYTEFEAPQTFDINQDLYVLDETSILDIPKNATHSIFSAKSEILSSIKSDSKFEINGTINILGKTSSIGTYYNFSNISKYEIADWAYRANIITEEEKIECYCELILSGNFGNICCLESVIEEISKYSKSNLISLNLKNKIDLIFHPTASTRTIPSDILYSFSTENFVVHYGIKTPEYKAIQVANYFEGIRSQFIELGFRTPLLEQNQTKYNVYLTYLPSSSGGIQSAAATTVKVNDSSSNPVCSSYIVIYDFGESTVFDTYVKEVATHEYFHAIQNAYNHKSNWFKEACANWAVININGSTLSCRNKIHSFSYMSTTMTNDDISVNPLYGACVFPLTIQHYYGGVDTIKSIYTMYGNYPPNSVTQTKLREIITEGICDSGYDGSFEEAYRVMVGYMLSPQVWFYNYASDVSYWSPNTNSTDPRLIPLEVNSSATGVLNNMTSKYFKISLPTSFSGSILIEVTFDGEGGTIQKYQRTNDVQKLLTFPNTYSTGLNGEAFALQLNPDSSLNESVIMISNTAEDGSLNYSITLTLLPLSQEIRTQTNSKYNEYVQNFQNGKYKYVKVTFSPLVNRIYQTFGSADTEIILFDRDGDSLTYDDNNGYENNAFASCNIAINTVHLIIKNNDYQTNSSTKLAITPTYGTINSTPHTGIINSYNEIECITRSNIYFRSYAEKNYTRFAIFIPEATKSYTISIHSAIDSYVYIIDPRSNLLLTSQNYNDNGAQNGMDASLTITLTRNIPYLIMYSAKDLTSIQGTFEYLHLIAFQQT